MDVPPDEPHRIAPVRALRAVLAEASARGRTASWLLVVTFALIALALVYEFFPRGPG